MNRSNNYPLNKTFDSERMYSNIVKQAIQKELKNPKNHYNDNFKLLIKWRGL